MPSRATVSTAHHPQHGHGRPARVEVHAAGGELVRPGQGRATPTPPHHNRCLPLRLLLLWPASISIKRYDSGPDSPATASPNERRDQKKKKKKKGDNDEREAPPFPSLQLPSRRRRSCSRGRLSCAETRGRQRGYPRGGSERRCGSAAPSRRSDIRLMAIAANGS